MNNLALVSQALRNIAGILISQGLYDKALQTLNVASNLSIKIGMLTTAQPNGQTQGVIFLVTQSAFVVGDQEALKEIQEGQKRANRFITLSKRKVKDPHTQTHTLSYSFKC
jgi:hypothetical protein